MHLPFPKWARYSPNKWFKSFAALTQDGLKPALNQTLEVQQFMSPTLFLSHNHADKPFVRRLAIDLGAQSIDYWLDDAEIKFGDSLIQKIRSGIDDVDYLVAILSPNSVNSPWVEKELDVAMTQEINNRRVKVIPLLLRHCELPGFLLGKFYADFTDPSNYDATFKRLVESVGRVFNSAAHNPESAPSSNLGGAVDKAWNGYFLPIYSKPFHRPFQYMGMTVAQAAEFVSGIPNSVGNIIIETDEVRMVLEAEGNYVSFIDVDLKKTAPQSMTRGFDPEVALGALSINPSELEIVRSKPHCHTYYDHRKKLKISVMCHEDNGPLSVSFSSKYYGM